MPQAWCNGSWWQFDVQENIGEQQLPACLRWGGFYCLRAVG